MSQSLRARGFDLIEGIFVVAKRYNSSSATKHVHHGRIEVTFTLNRHGGDIICISGSGGGGEGRFSYVDIDVIEHANAKNEEEDEDNKESINTDFDEGTHPPS